MKIVDKFVTPYLRWIKLVGLGALLGGGIWLGFRLDPDLDCGQMDAETAAELATLRTANYEYEQAELQRKMSEDEKAKAWTATQEKERLATQVRERNLYAQLAKIKEEMNNANKDPKCADLMKLEVCEAISVPLAPQR